MVEAMDLPLDHYQALENERLTITSAPFRGKLILRGGDNSTGKKEPNGAFIRAVKTALGVTLPKTVLHGVQDSKQGLYVCSTAYDEWFIFAPPEAIPALTEKLHSALKGRHYALVDISDYYAEVEIKGELTRTLLSAGITLDLDDNQFGDLQASFTDWHLANILLIRHDATEFRMAVRWSMARYLMDYLLESGEEVLQ